MSTKKVWKLKCSKLLVWFVSGPDRLDGSETVFCCKADVDGGQTHQWHAFETLVIFFHALGPCARSRFTCKGGSASGLDAASCRFRRCNSLSLRLSMKLSCLVVVPVWLCASTLSQLFEDVFLGKVEIVLAALLSLFLLILMYTILTGSKYRLSADCGPISFHDAFPQWARWN